ncbi:hypothetical protein BLNAU_15504 [Blattamonas nauphoetae]|uniref:Transmembrane protein n=1 Tax=Blattamonas nauphoetae TaxID=2049346 RepID=A0ABQ9XAG6_9EUKA|nr:hypothetical protein BLNAU_15504 [Blattamonas nauphoetae]
MLYPETQEFNVRTTLKKQSTKRSTKSPRTQQNSVSYTLSDEIGTFDEPQNGKFPFTKLSCEKLLEEQTRRYPNDIPRLLEVIAEHLGHALLPCKLITPQGIASLHSYKDFVNWPSNAIPSTSLLPLRQIVDKIGESSRTELWEGATRIFSHVLTTVNRSKADLLSPGQMVPSDILGSLVVLQAMNKTLNHALLIPDQLKSFLTLNPLLPTPEKTSLVANSTKESADATLTQSERLFFWAHGQSVSSSDQSGLTLWCRFLLPLLTSPNALPRHQQAHKLVGYAFLHSFSHGTPTASDWKEALNAFTASNPISEFLPPAASSASPDTSAPHFSSAIGCVSKMAEALASKDQEVCAECARHDFKLCCSLQRDGTLTDGSSMQRVFLEWIWQFLNASSEATTTVLLSLLQNALEQAPRAIDDQPQKEAGPDGVGLKDGMIVTRWVLDFIPFKVNELGDTSLFSTFSSSWYRLALNAAKWTEQLGDRLGLAHIQNSNNKALPQLDDEAHRLLNSAKRLVVFTRPAVGAKKQMKATRHVKTATDPIEFDESPADDLSDPDTDAGHTAAKTRAKQMKARVWKARVFSLVTLNLVVLVLILAHVDGPKWLKSKVGRDKEIEHPMRDIHASIPNTVGGIHLHDIDLNSNQKVEPSLGQQVWAKVSRQLVKICDAIPLAHRERAKAEWAKVRDVVWRLREWYSKKVGELYSALRRLAQFVVRKMKAGWEMARMKWEVWRRTGQAPTDNSAGQKDEEEQPLNHTESDEQNSTPLQFDAKEHFGSETEPIFSGEDSVQIEESSDGHLEEPTQIPESEDQSL